ncbi:M1 family metallopeptidase [Chryseobacterium daecheongense]|uniref:M1 family peptidase n=1 Tax=Chryseobacterium daecheongense TaxID=192389 RepID=A0A3N0W4J0_9FLAO|nr:M1 family metallopeptidase [Chryseobacterium daecheongense]ROH99989.1 M1 family peptidase [Chryseobacterium daecheongense]TDX95075.1 peptidase M1-like protein [Chryseobacterium daecheongense]
MKKLTYTLLFASGLAFGQFFENPKTFSKQDTLKGSNTKFRNFWDVKKYELSVEPDFEQKSIRGNNKISFEIIKDVTNPVFQIDLQKPMKADKVTASFPIADYKQDDDFIFIHTKKSFKKGEKFTIDIVYSGNPTIAKRAPWDGGWVFTKDENGNPWMSVADEGIGASIWLPTKDIWSDEPDNGIIMKITTPKDLVGVGNGRLIDKKTTNDKTTYTWEVKNPINAYSIIPSIGKYANFKDTYKGEKGTLDLDYWVLDYNLDKAKKQFQQVKPMLSAFEYWFGPYPFYEDSYKLVDTPYLGMEHQSNVAYGNHYMNGYLGNDLSGTGVGLNWDYIIIHESGHEWFANNITAKDQADMWIHESFTMYSEVLFTENYMDKKSADMYAQGIRGNIDNDKPIIGKYGVRNEGSGDMYPKGASMIHTIRQVINNDDKFRQILRGMNKDFYHQTVTTEQIENYISSKSRIDFSSVFDQYLRTVMIPTLEYSQKGNELKFRYTDVVKNLKLPIRINGDQIITPTESWQTVKLKKDTPVEFNKNYFINYQEVQ